MKKLFKDQNFNLKITISIIILASLICGFLGFIMETLVYYFKEGYLVKRGYTFGPIVPIYTYGALLIIFTTYRIKDKPWLVFIINVFLTGLLEYITGYVLINIFHTSLWDYHNEFLNIDGLVCFKSVMTFGVGSLLLIYVILPLLFKISNKLSEKKLYIISYGLGIIYLLDMLLYWAFKLW